MEKIIRTCSRVFPARTGGTLKVRIPKYCQFELQSQDPFTSDSCDIKIDVHGKNLTGQVAKEVTEDFDMHIISDTRRNALRIETFEESTPHWIGRQGRFVQDFLHARASAATRYSAELRLTARVPSDFSIDVEVLDGGIRLNGLFEGQDARILTSSASVFVEALQCPNIEIETRSGDIQSKVLNGNIAVRTDSGDVFADRLQGETIRCITDSGAINLGSLYGKYSVIRANSGDISIATLKGISCVRSKTGDLNLAGGEEDLDIEASRGQVRLQLSSPREVYVRCYRGDVMLGLPPTLSADVDLEGNQVGLHQDFRFQHLGVRDKVILGILKGSINAPPRKLEWRSSIFVRAPQGRIHAFPQTWAMLTKGGETDETAKAATEEADQSGKERKDIEESGAENGDSEFIVTEEGETISKPIKHATNAPRSTLARHRKDRTQAASEALTIHREQTEQSINSSQEP